MIRRFRRTWLWTRLYLGFAVMHASFALAALARRIVPPEHVAAELVGRTEPSA